MSKRAFDWGYERGLQSDDPEPDADTQLAFDQAFEMEAVSRETFQDFIDGFMTGHEERMLLKAEGKDVPPSTRLTITVRREWTVEVHAPVNPYDEQSIREYFADLDLSYVSVLKPHTFEARVSWWSQRGLMSSLRRDLREENL